MLRTYGKKKMKANPSLACLGPSSIERRPTEMAIGNVVYAWRRNSTSFFSHLKRSTNEARSCLSAGTRISFTCATINDNTVKFHLIYMHMFWTGSRTRVFVGFLSVSVLYHIGVFNLRWVWFDVARGDIWRHTVWRQIEKLLHSEDIGMLWTLCFVNVIIAFTLLNDCMKLMHETLSKAIR